MENKRKFRPNNDLEYEFRVRAKSGLDSYVFAYVFCREFTKKLRAIGCREIVRRGGGSHRKWFNPATKRGTTIPDWGQK